MNYKTGLISIITVALLLINIENVDAQFTSRLSFGFKGGANMTIPQVQNKFSIFSSAGLPQGIDKKYAKFSENWASGYHFIMFIRLGELNYIGLLPGFYNYTYKYENKYDWLGDNSYQTRFEFKQQNTYIDLPLVFKQKFLRKRKLQPYTQIGFYYSFLANSRKEVKSFETESVLASAEVEQATEILPTKDNFLLSNAGVLGGLGLNFRFKRAQIALETNFRYNFHNISSTENRYENYRTLGKFYDINDDLKLMNWNINFVFLVDLKCVTAKIPPRYKNLKE